MLVRDSVVNDWNKEALKKLLSIHLEHSLYSPKRPSLFGNTVVSSKMITTENET